MSWVVCCRNLLLGGGGYMSASLTTLGGASGAQQATLQPTFYSSRNWESFKQHAFKVRQRGCSRSGLGNRLCARAINDALLQ